MNNKKIIKYPYLIQRLENFRDSLDETEELLKTVYQGLTDLEQKYGKGTDKCLEEELGYLKNCLATERFFPIYRTIATIIENLFSGEGLEGCKHFLILDPEAGKDILTHVSRLIGEDPDEKINGLLYGDEQNKFFKRLDDLGDADSLDLENLGKDETVPPSVRENFKKISLSQEFEEAFNKITKPLKYLAPGIKLMLLRNWLIPHGEQRGWFEEEREEKTTRINKMIEIYVRLSGSASSKLGSTGITKNASAAERKIVSTNQTSDEKKSIKRTRSDEESDQDLPIEDKISKHFLKILDKFDYLLDDPELEFILNTLLTLTAGSVQEKIHADITAQKQYNWQTQQRAVEMIKDAEPDAQLLSELKEASVEFKYTWFHSPAVQEAIRADLAKFKNLAKNNEDLRGIVNYLQRRDVIEALNNTVRKDKEVVKTISKNLTKDNLLDVFKSEPSPRKKESLKLVMELLDLTGDPQLVNVEKKVQVVMEPKNVVSEKLVEIKPSEVKPVTPPEIKKNEPFNQMTSDEYAKSIMREIENLKKYLDEPSRKTFLDMAIKRLNEFFQALQQKDVNAIYVYRQYKEDLSAFVNYVKKNSSLKGKFIFFQ